MNSTPIFIAKTCSGREAYENYLRERIPGLTVSYDTFTDSGLNDTSYQNFQNGLYLANGRASVQMEDDILLCNDFLPKISAEINKRPDDVIQFFSMRKADIEIGSRYELGSKFMMCQCFYLPEGMSKDLHEFSLSYNVNKKEKNSPNDPCVADFLKMRKLKYWLVAPNLVEHRVGKSRIDPRRSSKRVSYTFNHLETWI